MADGEISAEVEPASGQANRAALALQRLGFRILHIGSTISISASQLLWEATFDVSFEPQRKLVLAETGSEVTYQKAGVDTLHIPDALHDLVVDVMFVEPPQFH